MRMMLLSAVAVALVACDSAPSSSSGEPSAGGAGAAVHVDSLAAAQKAAKENDRPIMIAFGGPW